VDLDEFEEMAKRVVETNSMFTGAEAGRSFHRKLTIRQLDALINHDWPTSKKVEKEVDDPLKFVIKNIKQGKKEQGEKKLMENEKRNSVPGGSIAKQQEEQMKDKEEIKGNDVLNSKDTDSANKKTQKISKVSEDGLDSSRDARLKKLITTGRKLRTEGILP
jgi:hypothetical protein